MGKRTNEKEADAGGEEAHLVVLSAGGVEFLPYVFEKLSTFSYLRERRWGVTKKGDDEKLCTATFFKQLSISACSFFREDIVGVAETLIE